MSRAHVQSIHGTDHPSGRAGGLQSRGDHLSILTWALACEKVGSVRRLN